MSTATGIIKAIAKTGKSFKLDTGETWYSVFATTQLGECGRGDSVTFEFVTKGTFNNVKGNVRKLEGAAAPAPSSSSGGSTAAPWSGGGRSFPVGALAPERTINRQNALTNATNLVSSYIGEKATEEGDWSETEGAIVRQATLIIEVARVFESYTTGDMDAEDAARALAEIEGE